MNAASSYESLRCFSFFTIVSNPSFNGFNWKIYQNDIISRIDIFKIIILWIMKIL